MYIIFHVFLRIESMSIQEAHILNLQLIFTLALNLKLDDSECSDEISCSLEPQVGPCSNEVCLFDLL
jgi:hypothetical protein